MREHAQQDLEQHSPVKRIPLAPTFSELQIDHAVDVDAEGDPAAFSRAVRPVPAQLTAVHCSQDARRATTQPGQVSDPASVALGMVATAGRRRLGFWRRRKQTRCDDVRSVSPRRHGLRVYHGRSTTGSGS